MKRILILFLLMAGALSSCITWNFPVVPYPVCYDYYLYEQPKTYLIYEDIYDMTPGYIIKEPGINGSYYLYEDIYDMTPSKITPARETYFLHSIW